MINPKHHSLPSPPPAVPLAGRSGAPKVICQPPRAGPKLCQVLPSLTLAPYSAVVAWLALHPIIVRQSTQPRDAMGCQGQDDSASDEYCRLQVLPMLSVCQMLPNPSTDNMGQNTIVRRYLSGPRHVLVERCLGLCGRRLQRLLVHGKCALGQFCHSAAPGEDRHTRATTIESCFELSRLGLYGIIAEAAWSVVRIHV